MQLLIDDQGLRISKFTHIPFVIQINWIKLAIAIANCNQDFEEYMRELP